MKGRTFAVRRAAGVSAKTTEAGVGDLDASGGVGVIDRGQEASPPSGCCCSIGFRLAKHEVEKCLRPWGVRCLEATNGQANHRHIG